ncbi:hypothetical protein [Budvicia aquatica]|uniref:Aminopeptidase n=1 Tax=Budvicia aquatica TaxID=82979 RepID=A0A2C6DT95_9GAMM|nr:hypothetical protein [Budvicia aquatica]PHI31695.1 hypothetical protein CRN84_21360 [Budvicia aquatica]VFS52485.1 Uncharacterised protein [Budvicia aquatica]
MFITRTRKAAFFIIAGALLLSGCSTPASKNPTYVSSRAMQAQLSDNDVFDSDLAHEITNEEIRITYDQPNVGVNLASHSPIILVQSGSLVPDASMQTEMAKYYRVSVYSGIPPTKPRVKKDSEPVIQNNYMKSLRLVAAKGKQPTVVVYWGSLETGIYDETSKSMIWSPYRGGKLPTNTKSLRYLVRFVAVDTRTGNWVTHSPLNTETDYTVVPFGSQTNELAQLDELKKNAYIAAANDFSTRYQRIAK